MVTAKQLPDEEAPIEQTPVGIGDNGLPSVSVETTELTDRTLAVLKRFFASKKNSSFDARGNRK